MCRLRNSKGIQFFKNLCHFSLLEQMEEEIKGKEANLDLSGKLLLHAHIHTGYYWHFLLKCW